MSVRLIILSFYLCVTFPLLYLFYTCSFCPSLIRPLLPYLLFPTFPPVSYSTIHSPVITSLGSVTVSVNNLMVN